MSAFPFGPQPVAPPTWHTFLLTTEVASSSGITYGVNRPVKYSGNPVFSGGGVWDASPDYARVFTNPLFPPASRYRMLYQAYELSPGTHVSQCYAYSADGIAWTAPNLGLHADAITGTTANNLVMPAAFDAWPQYNPGGAANQTWLMVVDLTPSPNGLFQRRVYGATDIRGPYVLVNSLGDDVIKDSLALVRRRDGKWIVYYQNGVYSNDRTIGAYLSSSSDLATCTWADQGTVLSNGGVNDQRYAIMAERDGTTILAFVVRYNSGTTQLDAIQLFVSPATDGLTMTLKDANWLVVGGSGAWDYPMVVGGAPVRVGNEWWHYYTALQYFHVVGSPPYPAAMGVAKIGYQRIGQVSGAGGSLTTTALTPTTPHLIVNVDASAGGARLDVAVLDAGTGLARTGYALADCDGITSNTYGAEVTWGSGARRLPVGSSSQLQFRLTGAAVLYAYVAD